MLGRGVVPPPSAIARLYSAALRTTTQPVGRWARATWRAPSTWHGWRPSVGVPCAAHTDLWAHSHIRANYTPTV